ncbi:MAG: hypothetical protein R3B90_07510 [Planctomycetaceae bacterium]
MLLRHVNALGQCGFLLLLLCGGDLLATESETPSVEAPSVEAPTTDATTADTSAAGATPVAETPEVVQPAIDELYTLRYQFRPGQVLRYVSNDETEFDVQQSEAATSVNYSTKSWKRYVVEKVNDDGSVVLQLYLDHVLMRAEGDGKTLEYDSRLPGAPPAEFAHLPIGGEVATITVDARGAILAYEAKVETAGDSAGTLERDLQVLAILPEAPVAIGGTWREIIEAPLKVEGNLTRKVKLQRMYTLTSVEDGVASIDLRTIRLTRIDDPSHEAQLIQKTPGGMLRIDLDRGLVLTKRTNLNNQVVGFNGAGSSLKVKRQVVEELTTTNEPLVGKSSSDR